MDSQEYHDIILRVRGEQEARRLADETERATGKLRQFARALDDAQYVFQGGQGLRPILNNLTEFSPLLGAIAIGVDVLIRNWSTLENVFANSKLGSEAEEMERLGKATSKTADETARLNHLQRQAGVEAAQAKALSESQRFQESGVTSAIGTFGIDNALKGVIGLYGGRYANSPEAAKELADKNRTAAELARLEQTRLNPMEGQSFATQREIEVAKAAADKAQAALANKIREQAERDLARAATDPSMLRGLLNAGINNPGAFGAGGMGFLAGLMGATPEAFEANKANTRAEADGAAAKRARDEHNKRLQQIMDQSGAAIEAQQAGFQREQEQRRDLLDRHNAARGREAMDAGAGGLVSSMITGALASGMSADQAAMGGVEALTAAGVPFNEALKASFRMTRAASMDIASGALNSAMRSPQLFGAAELGNRLLTAGSKADDPAMRAVRQAEESTRLLRRLVQLNERTRPATAG